MAFMDYMPQFGQNLPQDNPMAGDDTLMQIDLKRKLALADQLRQAEMPQGQMVSGRYVAPAWTQVLANALGKVQANNIEKKAYEQYGQAQQAKQKKLSDLLQGKEVTAPVDYNEAGNMPGMEQTTRQPYSQQEFLSKAVGVMPELAPKLIESQVAQYGKEEQPISLGEGGILVNRKGEVIAQNPKTEKENKIFGAVSPSDFTPESLNKFAQSGGKDYSLLQRIEKPQLPHFQTFREGTSEVTYQINPDGTRTKVASGPAFSPKDTTSNFSTDTVDMLADQALAGDKSVFVGRGMTGANIGAIRERMNQKMKALGWSGRDIAAQNADFMANVAANRTAAVKGANIELAGGEFTNIAPLAKDAGSQVSRSGFLPFGKVEVMFNEQTNDPKLAEFAAYNNGLVNTYARAISPTGVPTVSDKNHARELLLTAKNQQAYNATVDALTKEIEAAKRSPGQTRGALRGNITGRENAGMPSSDAIAAELKRRGL